MSDLPILGKENVVSPVDSFILDITHYLDVIRPKDYFIFREDFDPHTYFITSGDAINKTQMLIADLDSYKTHIQECINYQKAYTNIELEFLCIIDNAIASAYQLLSDLYTAKGENCFLEIEWEDHNIRVVPKNPRAR